LINQACFPVSYQDKYYTDVVACKDEGLCKLAYVGGFVVGAAACRLEDITEGEHRGKRRIYIMTLGVLAAYRGRGIGTKLIQSIFDYYQECKDSSSSSSEGLMDDVVEISLHVQISNDDAIKFYTDRFGFVKGEQVDNYYKRIDPPHCYRLYKTLVL
jgi:ribosomal protein S18 acetylase RimI-like enzyme